MTVILGFLSHQYIEKLNFRRYIYKASDFLKCKPIYMSLALVLASSLVFFRNGLESRLSTQQRVRYKKAMEAAEDWFYPNPNLFLKGHDLRFIKGRTDKNILLIGSSHIAHTYSYVKTLDSEYNIYYLTMGGCFVSPSYVVPRRDCSNIQDYKPIVQSIKFDKIVTSLYTLTNALPQNYKKRRYQLLKRIKEYDEFLKFIKSHIEQVYLILPELRGREFDPKQSIRFNLRNFITIEEIKKEYRENYEALTILDELSGVKIIDPVEYLCDKVCMVMDKNSIFFYKDKSHFRPWYAKKSMGYLREIFIDEQR